MLKKLKILLPGILLAVASCSSLGDSASSFFDGTSSVEKDPININTPKDKSDGETPAVVLPLQTTNPGVTSLRVAGSQVGVEYGYIEYLPDGYSAASGKNYPLVIFLHGIGELGDGSAGDSHISGQTKGLGYLRNSGYSAGPQYNIDHAGIYYNAVLLSPQEFQSVGYWRADKIDQLVTYAIAHYKVDPKKVLVTGLSLGGGGVWAYAAGYASKIAAIMPISAVNRCDSGTDMTPVITQNVKVWSFHALNDGTVNINDHYICMNALGNALHQTASYTTYFTDTNVPTGPEDGQTGHFNSTTKHWDFEPEIDCKDSSGHAWSTPVCGTMYRTGDHGIWYRVYDDLVEPMNWLLSQKRP